MANEMSRISLPGAKFNNAYEMDETKTVVGPGEWFHVPAGVTQVYVTLEITGKGRLEATTDSRAKVSDDTATAFLPWPLGDQNKTSQAILGGGSAFRQVNISGTTRLTARAE